MRSADGREKAVIVRRRGFWAEIQRENARRKRQRERAHKQAMTQARKAKLEAERRARAAMREAAESERERKRLHIEECKAEAAAMNADVDVRVEELDGILATGVSRNAAIRFSSLKQELKVRAFDAKGLDRPQPAPDWEDYAPREPGSLGRVLGRGGRYERLLAERRQQYETDRSAHEAAEMERKRRHAERLRAYDRQVSEMAAPVEARNAEVDQLQRDFLEGDPEAVAQYFTLVLDVSPYPDDFPHRTRLRYLPDPRELIIEFELPPLSVIPTDREYRYVQARDEIVASRRQEREVKQRYADLIGQVTLRTLHEIFSSDGPAHVDLVSFYGRVSAVDKATGQPIRPLLINVSAPRETFSSLVLTDLDPRACLRHLNALVSPHPHDLEAVKPLVDFEALLAMHDFVDGIDVLATLDSRPDLLAMTPREFEHFTRQLFERMGMKGWTTREVKDDGVDAVVTNEDPVLSGLCIVQAKRYRGAVGVGHVRELIGAMDDKRATKGILVTTSWVTVEGRELARRNGRAEIIEGENLKHLCQEYMGLDILISLPKAPPRRGRDQPPDGR